MNAPVIIPFNDLHDHIGRSFGPSAPLLIDQSRIDAFAEITGDRQWIHVDPARATAAIGGTIAHGYLALALIPYFTAELLIFDNVAHGLNYGLNKVRFISPIVAPSRVAAVQMIAAVRDRGDGRLITLETLLTVAGAKRPAVRAETLLFVVGGQGRLDGR